ncbi:MAG: cyclomaltodextrinase / maltogenic alpha-amylase / neopullulanase [Clostridia bacterium]|nr:cyclomaltodextrinase / maltogenic alpha-amylase / neopullulanase [Clostridia bacterium]
MFYHQPTLRFCQPLAPNKLLLRLKTLYRDKQTCQVIYEDKSLKTAPMYLYARTPHYFYYQTEIELSKPWQCRYFFKIQENKNSSYLLKSTYSKTSQPFSYKWSSEDIFNTPDWIYDAIFYQIFPDRFYNGNPKNDPPGTQSWGEKPTFDNFFGGDLEGIEAKIPYLKYLGVNALWLNPIFASPSNHRYNTSDYMKIDPALGDKSTLRHLVNSLKSANMHIILDGVFNHTGTDFFAFKDAVLNGANSRYKDWYYFREFPVRSSPHANYECWWNIPSLPKLKATNPEVRKYLLSVGTYWLREAGIDGWRLDVPNEIEPTFWVEFRQEVKETNPEAYIVGEIWHDARFWLKGKHFDAVMNYLFRDLVLNYFARRRFPISTLDFLLGLIRLRYPEAANFAMLNLMGSHDTARIITAFQEGLSGINGHSGSYEEAIIHLRPALILQFTYQGAPMIYYGDEVGMTGGADPDCRRTMPWNSEVWNKEIHALYRRLTSLRNNLKPLRQGYFQPLATDDNAEVYTYARRLDDEKIIIALNASDYPQTATIEAKELDIEEGCSLHDGLNNRNFEVKEGKIQIPLEANYGAILYRLK